MLKLISRSEEFFAAELNTDDVKNIVFGLDAGIDQLKEKLKAWERGGTGKPHTDAIDELEDLREPFMDFLKSQDFAQEK